MHLPAPVITRLMSVGMFAVIAISPALADEKPQEPLPFWRTPLRLRPLVSKMIGVAFSSDGKLVAVGTGYGGPAELIVWDVKTRQQKFSRPMPNSVRRLEFSPDNSLIACACFNNNVYVCDAKDGKTKLTLKGHTLPVYSVSFSTDGKWLVTAARDTTVKVWDLSDGKLLRSITSQSDRVYAAKVSPDGQLVATAGRGKVINLHELNSGKLVRSFTGHTGTLETVRFTPDSKRLLSCGWDDRIIVWDIDGGQQLTSIKDNANVVSVRLINETKQIVSVSDDGNIHVWNTDDGKELASHKGHDQRIYGMDWHEGEGLLATAAADGLVKLWRVNRNDDSEGFALAELPPLERPIEFRDATGLIDDVTHSLDGRWLVTAGKDVVRVRHARTGTVQTTVPHKNATCVSISHDTRLCASGGSDGSVRVWTREDGRMLANLQGQSSPVYCVQFSPVAMLLAVGTHEGEVQLIDLDAGKLLGVMDQSASSVRSVAFSSDGMLLASGADDGTVRIWDVESLELKHTLLGHTDLIRDVVFLPNGKTLATSSADTTIRTWHVDNGRPQHVMRGHGGPVWALAASVDGASLASGGFDRTLRIWNSETGKARQVVPVSSSSIASLSYARNGFDLVGSTHDSGLKRWSPQFLLTRMPPGESVKLLAGHKPEGVEVHAAKGGEFDEAEVGGRKAFRAKGDYLYVKIDDDFVHDKTMDDPLRTIVTLTMYDEKKGSFYIQYDANRSGVYARPQLGADETHVSVSRRLTLKGGRRWFQASFELAHARLSNKLLGADFRIRAMDGAKIVVQQIKVTRFPDRIASNSSQVAK